jgi:hypothetical protein
VQTPGYARAVEDLAVARPGGLDEPDRTGSGDVEEARERTRKRKNEQRTQLRPVDSAVVSLEYSEPAHPASVRTEEEKFM